MNILNSDGSAFFRVADPRGEVQIRFEKGWNSPSNHVTGHTAEELIPEVVKAVFKSESLTADVKAKRVIFVTKGLHQREKSRTDFAIYHFNLSSSGTATRHVYEALSPKKTIYASPFITGKRKNAPFLSPGKENAPNLDPHLLDLEIKSARAKIRRLESLR